MRKIFIFAFCSVFLTFAISSVSLAQKKRKSVKPKQDEILTIISEKKIQVTNPNCKPSSKPAVVFVSVSGELTLNGATVERTNFTQELANYLCDKLPFEEVTHIKADENTPFNLVTEVIRYVRELEIDRVVLIVGTDTNIQTKVLRIPAEDEESTNEKVKAEPLVLATAIAPDGTFELNGKTQTVESIKKVLNQTFETRKKKRVFKEGRREIEKTTFVYARTQTEFGEVVKFIKEIEKTGANPVGLDVDDYYLKVIF